MGKIWVRDCLGSDKEKWYFVMKLTAGAQASLVAEGKTRKKIYTASS